jgi:acylpyruvate hydrolase
MKFICIGKNYALHAKEMNSEVPTEPVFFLKPETALHRNGKPFFLPSFSNEIHHEIEVLLLISQTGKGISEKFAHRYYEQIGIGIDFTARDIQAQCKKGGLPWEKAKAFDNSAAVGKFYPKDQFDPDKIEFHLTINGETRQKGSTADLIFSFDKIISYVSDFITLKKGDVIFTGTPEGVGPVHRNDKIEGFLGKEKALGFNIK